jgi:hypothetical protein
MGAFVKWKILSYLTEIHWKFMFSKSLLWKWIFVGNSMERAIFILIAVFIVWK